MNATITSPKRNCGIVPSVSYFEIKRVDIVPIPTNIRKQNKLAEVMASQYRQRRERRPKQWNDKVIIEFEDE
jgi:hypothetical protein